MNNILAAEYDHASNRLDTNIYYNTVTVGVSSIPGGMTKGVWRHYCLVVAGTSGTVYLGGTANNTFTLSQAILPNLNLYSSYIGRSNFGSDSLWLGYLDDFRIYARALQSSEVSAIYNYRGDGTGAMILVSCGGCSAGQVRQCYSDGKLSFLRTFSQRF